MTSADHQHNSNIIYVKCIVNRIVKFIEYFYFTLVARVKSGSHCVSDVSLCLTTGSINADPLSRKDVSSILFHGSISTLFTAFNGHPRKSIEEREVPSSRLNHLGMHPTLTECVGQSSGFDIMFN